MLSYPQWNNIISRHFFNSVNAGKDIHLYLTKMDIIHLAKSYFDEETEDEIWDDFIRAIKRGIPGSNGNIITKAKQAYDKRNLIRIDSIEINHPPYITYLVFLVLPLIEGIDGDYSANNYYDRLNKFLNNNQINETISTNDFRNNQINLLWDDLGNWANIKKSGDFGLFKVIPFTNSNWIYVGKVFSQCVFPPRAIKRLPELFLQAGMIPDSYYLPAEIKRHLLQYGSSILQLSNNTLDAIRKSDTNELGQSIIEKAKREYNKWTGESHSIDDTGTQTKRNDIASRIYLQLQLFNNEGRIKFSFRIKSANEFPEDLSFNGIEIREEKGGYSKTIDLPFKVSFQLKDNFNKWIAKFPDKDVRLFIGAGSFQFSTDYWMETDTLTKTSWMYLFCKNSKREVILDWLQNHCSSFEDESDYENIPDNYSLFRFLNPSEGIESIPELTIIKEKSIRLTSALEFDFRTFTNDFLPEVEIINADGTESVYMQYKNNDEKIPLRKKLSTDNRWLLPNDISLYADFNIKVEDEIFMENETAYKIISSNDSSILLNESKLPKRDCFGRITTDEIEQYSIGSNTIGLNLLRQLPYTPLFKGKNEDTANQIIDPVYTHSEGNILLSYLTLKGTITAQDFYTAFEFLHSKYFGNKTQNEKFNYSKIKKASLNFLDYLGYLDYEYEAKSIVVNPPQLVYIPASKGRKVLLIGGRDSSFINAIIETAPKHHLQVEITRQFQSNEDLMLPDVITLKSFKSSNDNFGERNLIAFANELNIKFNPAELVQVSLQHFSSNISNYESDVFSNRATELTYEDWARYIFNTDTLKLDKSFSENFDKDFTMLEYRLRPWEFHHRLWVNQKCYDIDKNWGKYLVLKHYNKNAILYDRNKEKVAIPLELPIPRLLAESIMLLSGFAPEYAFIEGKSYRIYENIPSIFIQNLFKKLDQKTIDYNF